MMVLCKSRIDAGKADEFATSEEFCKLFTEDVAGLYLLSFVLTANHETAEQCFAAGLADCMNGEPVFKQWAHSWAKRMIVRNAVRVVAPRPNRARRTFTGIHPDADGRRQRTQDQPAAIARVLALGDFDRFVFVMSVLERYTDEECSDLLGCSQQDVGEARLRALQQITVEHTKHDAA
jgi:DNA-directed RNA polymerase specialized sigma24 family protein